METDFHRELVNQVMQWARRWGRLIASDQRLPNGRIADVVAISPDGEVIIVECKTLWRDADLERAWLKYRDQCHRFWLAVPYLPPGVSLARPTGLSFGSSVDGAGILVTTAAGTHTARVPLLTVLPNQRVDELAAALGTRLPVW